MGSEYKRLLEEFQGLTRGEGGNVEAYLRGKLPLLGEQGGKLGIDWRHEFREAYNRLRISQDMRNKLTILFQQLTSQITRILSTHSIQQQLLQNQLTLSRTTFQQQKHQLTRTIKQLQQSLFNQRSKTFITIQQLQEKQFELMQMQQKLQQYEQEIQEIKSKEYQNMMNSIKQEEILSSHAQMLLKQNALLREQVKEVMGINGTLNKLVAQIKTDLDTMKIKYNKTKRYIIKRKSRGGNNTNNSRDCQQGGFVSQVKDYEIVQGNVSGNKAVVEENNNLIEIRDNFSFKNSIENQNQSAVAGNNPQGFYNFDSSSQQFYYGSQQSPSRAFMQREKLNLTQRDDSTYSRNTKQFLRTKTNLYQDKQNVSQNTWDYHDFDYYPNQKVSRFGSKRNDNEHNKQDPSNCSVDDNLPIARGFETQQRVSLLLSKQNRRRLNTSFNSKNIQQFRQYDNNHFIINTDKLTDSMIDNLGRGDDGIVEQSKGSELSSSGCEVDEIVINEELLSSCKRRGVGYSKRGQDTGEGKGSRLIEIQLGMIDAKFVKSVQVKVQPTQKQKTLTPQPDMYYGFFSLTAQCAKLNHKNFNQAISVYFNLQQEYNNVLKKMIPINKWYNYIQDQIQTSLKYKR